MSKENVELHRRAYDDWNRRDRDAWMALADPDVEVFPAFMEMEGGPPLRGLKGTERLWDVWLESFPDLRFEVDEIRDLGDTTLAAVRVCGRAARSEVPVEQESWHVMHWRNRKVVRFQPFHSEADALEAAGLSE